MIDNNYLRVGIYERLSKEDRNKLHQDEDSESIKNQRHMLLDYINKNPHLKLVDEYCDEDLSGAGTYRPEFTRLIEDCQNHKLDIVLCKSQSRFSRDMEIIEKYLHNKFKEWNIRFISLSDNADTANLGNKKTRQINGLVNEWYLEDVSNNIRSAFLAKMKQGEFISPFASFGYEISPENNNKLVVDPIAAEVVKTIYNLYLTGLGFTSIAKYLNNKNIPSPSYYKYQKGIKLNIISQRPRDKIKWSSNAIKRILKNEIYIGNLIQGKRTTISYKNHKIKTKTQSEWIRKENTHKAIIDKETFNKVQTYIKERTKPIKTTGIVHLFSGKVYCLECQSYMRKKNSKTHEYLLCSKNKDIYDNCSNKASIRYDLLSSIILDAINKKIQKFYDKEKLNKLVSTNKKKKYKQKIKALEEQKLVIESQIAKTHNYLKNIYEDKVNGIITTNQFKDLLITYTSNENEYQSQIKSINNEITYYQVKEESNTNQEVFNKYLKLNELNRVIIDEFIDKIYIGKINTLTNRRDIKIKWNFNI